MGIARIYAGVHWPFDILGGIAVGIISGYFIHWLLRGTRAELSPIKKEENLTAVI
jgi:membrane-associated phospholipid phosphatase